MTVTPFATASARRRRATRSRHSERRTRGLIADRYVLWYANSAIGNALNEVAVGLKARRHTRRIVRIISPLDCSGGNPARKHARKRALDEFTGMCLYALVRRAISTEIYPAPPFSGTLDERRWTRREKKNVSNVVRAAVEAPRGAEKLRLTYTFEKDTGSPTRGPRTNRRHVVPFRCSAAPCAARMPHRRVVIFLFRAIRDTRQVPHTAHPSSAVRCRLTNEAISLASARSTSLRLDRRVVPVRRGH